MILEPTAAPRVSVLMTLYNKGPFVAEAVRSVLQNTFTDLELLVVDDASTDGGLVNARAVEDPRIRIIESEHNTGRAAAANRGFDAARGDYVAVLDADDIAHPERLARQVAFMDANPQVGACGSAYQVLGDPSTVGTWPATDSECRGKMLFGDPVVYGTAMFRRSIVEAHRLRCDAAWRKPGMDYLFVLRIGPHAHYANLQEPLIFYRMGENNMRHGSDSVEDQRRIVREVFRFFGITHTDEQLELHLAFHGVLGTSFTAERVAALWAWKLQLVRTNRERGLFPADLFEAQLDRRWQRLFHRFADTDLGAAMAHMRLSKSWPIERLSYLGKVTIKRCLKGKA